MLYGIQSFVILRQITASHTISFAIRAAAYVVPKNRSSPRTYVKVETFFYCALLLATCYARIPSVLVACPCSQSASLSIACLLHHGLRMLPVRGDEEIKIILLVVVVAVAVAVAAAAAVVAVTAAAVLLMQ